MPAPTNLYRPYLDRFANPSGPGDSRPTASEIIKNLNAESKLKGKTVLITGGNSGLGLETAKALHSTGAQVFVAARSEEKAKNAAAEVSKQSNGPEAQSIVMDLGSLASVRTAAAKFAELSDRLDILITNAGVMATPFGHTEEGFEQQFGCNHLGHFLLFRLLQPLLSKSATETSPSRVIALSSGGHRFSEIHFDDIHYRNRPYEPLAAYAQSKTANIWMANSIERHYAPKIRGLSVHPGVILETGITRHFQEDTLGSAGDLDYFKKVGFNVQQGAATSVWAALDPHFDQAGGVYLADVGVARLAEEGDQVNEPVYAPYAYDEEGEERLWRMSSQMVGLSESE